MYILHKPTCYTPECISRRINFSSAYPGNFLTLALGGKKIEIEKKPCTHVSDVKKPANDHFGLGQLLIAVAHQKVHLFHSKTHKKLKINS
jgi:hypothetical protein